jgi:hypothetical protein
MTWSIIHRRLSGHTTMPRRLDLEAVLQKKAEGDPAIG